MGDAGGLGCFHARIMAVEPQDRTACAACAKQQTMKRCTRCKAVVYCSRDCQTSDWQTHRLLCGPNPQHTVQTEDTCSSSGGEPEPPLQSGARVHPDGRYEAFAGGNRCDERGFPVPKTTAEQKSSANKQCAHAWRAADRAKHLRPAKASCAPSTARTAKAMARCSVELSRADDTTISSSQLPRSSHCSTYAYLWSDGCSTCV